MTETESRTPRMGRWALTGAAGTIGRHLRGSMGDVFEELTLLDVRPIADTAPHERSQVVDLRDLSALRAALAGAEGVIHLGGLADEADFHDLAEVNIVGTYHVLEAARRAGLRRVVYASSNRVTGHYPTTTVVGPEDPYRPDGFYGVSKAAGESLCRLYSDTFGMQVACLRIGSFEAEPATARELRTWLSPRDCTAAFAAAVSGDDAFTTFYAVSANAELWWDTGAGERVGFHPVDDASAFAAHASGELVEPQGGGYATAEHVLARQRHRG